MTRLSDTLRAAADEPVELDLDALHERVARRHRQRVRARAGACAVGVVLALGGIGVAAGAGGSEAGHVRASEVGEPGAGEPTAPGEPAPSTGSSTTAETTAPETSAPETSAPETSAPETSTTTEAPTTAPTTAPPPSTTAPAPSVVELAWDYVGIEQYRLSQPQCPQLTHWLDAEAVASDGSAWTLREDYCGEHLGDRWQGAGTFSLTSAAGALSGRMTSVAPMPTDGVPYSYAIEQGTGSLAGATGGCSVTIVMTDKAFGSARHEGTITCTVTLPGGSTGSTDLEVPESV